MNLFPLVCISHLPRSVMENFRHLKASEFYSVPCLLYGILPDLYFQHFILLVEAIIYYCTGTAYYTNCCYNQLTVNKCKVIYYSLSVNCTSVIKWQMFSNKAILYMIEYSLDFFIISLLTNLSDKYNNNIWLKFRTC